jgi:hypothetical protein
MVDEHELIPGVAVRALAQPERMTLGALRLMAAGRGDCPTLRQVFDEQMESQGQPAADGLATLVRRLPLESGRKLTLGWLCVRGVTWDEAAILALIEAGQRASVPEISMWFARLGVDQPSPALQRGLAWAAAAFMIADKMFDPGIGELGAATVPPATARLRDQIETQLGLSGLAPRPN